ncbi:bifunctional adenosine 5'-phosphosulfate phosphorylase/adenylylsulfatase HINT4 isoform X2 [Cryptomeria japonica]|uniref:bifunctional adenosine 5'-phosphosulfate phosphorylase/adenylylsulfatase HINT4 isoform X2 n=1 Tax=Cryptomeria japonica TaxID=3369 RepID=UPI0025AD67B2|nr:bifunctional adenosine 5'-phosphosulfate phosphorylase/adenylylsulfatase HINT4 isoform X2 [Cryptomeria japonica]
MTHCIFCPPAIFSSAKVLHQDDKVYAIEDIKPAALRHYLIIPVDHIATVRNLQRRKEDYALVEHMLKIGQSLLQRDAPGALQYRFGFHQPPFNSVNHLHLHCFALPYTPRWKKFKYFSYGPVGVFLEANKLLEKIKPMHDNL